MSAAAQGPTRSQAIPTRRILLEDASQLPSDYSTTPGGTLFSTTPGGTRIIYDRASLMQMRNSPLSRTPPSGLPDIPGVTSKASPPKLSGSPSRRTHELSKPHPLEKSSSDVPSVVASNAGHDEDQFKMDI